MIADTVLQSIISRLNDTGYLKITVGGSIVIMRANSERTKFLLSSPVYTGYDYIPDSVRKYVAKNTEFKEFGLVVYLKTYDKIFEVYLHHNGSLDTLTKSRLSHLLEDFAVIADEIRLILDENDKNDLIHVRK